MTNSLLLLGLLLGLFPPLETIFPKNFLNPIELVSGVASVSAWLSTVSGVSPPLEKSNIFLSLGVFQIDDFGGIPGNGFSAAVAGVSENKTLCPAAGSRRLGTFALAPAFDGDSY